MLESNANKEVLQDTFYHGSRQIVTEPIVYSRSINKDFGVGFYCTSIHQQAYKWATRGLNGKGIVNEYRFPKEALLALDILIFKEMSDAWLDFVARCRTGVQHNHDIVIGPMADDTVFNRVNEYINGTISKEQFWQLCRFKYPTHQVCFCTEKALKYLEFVRSEEVLR